MKLYFHLQLPSPDTFITAVIETENTDDNLKSCLSQLCKCLQQRENMKVDVNTLELFNHNKKPVLVNALISSFSSGVDLTIKVIDVKNSEAKNKIIYEKSDIRKFNDYGISQTGKAEDSNSNENIAPLLTKASQYVGKKRHDLAIVNFKEVLNTNPNNRDALFGIAYIYYNAERYKDSVPYFEKFVTKNSCDEVVLLDFSRALTRAGDPAKAASVLSRCINDLKRSNQSADRIHDANVALGEALESMGQLPNAFQLFLSVSQMTEKQHLGALIGYARIGYQISHVSLDDVFIVILNAVAHRKNDVKFHSYFAEMVQENGGYEALQKQMQDLWFDTQTVLYIATFLRDCGTLAECLKLAKHAFSLAPANVNIALLIFHIHENLCLLTDGLSFVADFFNCMLERQVVRKLDLSPFVKVIRFLEKGEEEELDSYLRKQLAPEKEEKKPSPKGTLSNTELELLGLYFTVVKTCYVNGYLRAIPLFINLLDPLFKMNEDLHKTLIRNEQAYYSCISQIYKSIPPSNTVMANSKLYFIGDSHVLPSAWRTINGCVNEFCIHPILVTGLKIWHLRKEARFYTKSCFQHSLDKIPQGAVCIFAFGEIDCREGIIRAVQKCAYDNIDECLKNLVDIYIKCLLDIQKKKKAKMFVHPVPPVIKDTLVNVKKFNEHLKNRVVKTPKLFWLDFFDELLNESGSLKDEYAFDGVHLHPSYLSLLEKSMQKHL